MLPKKIKEIDLTEFVKKYMGEDIKIQPYQEKLMESLKFKNGSEIKIFDGNQNDKERVFDYFYTHWKLSDSEKGHNHQIGQQCLGGGCPICKAVEAVAQDVGFITKEEMTI